MREVTKGEFFAAIGSVNCHPHIVGRYGAYGEGFRSDFVTPDGTLVGRAMPPKEWGDGDTYYLASRPTASGEG